MPDQDARFPLRVAAVDVGSNAIRFAAAEFRDSGRYRELDYQRVALRLGRHAFRTGRLPEDAVAGVVEAMLTFRRSLDDLGVGTYRAVATSAVRESRNGGEVVERVRRESGLHLETITGDEEARLVWVAVRRRLDLDGRLWLLVDLGGGSLEISLMDGAGIEWSQSHPLGTVRLLEAVRGATDPAAALDALMDGSVGTLRVPRIGDGGAVGLVATGGNIETLAGIARAGRNGGGTRVLPAAALQQVTTRLASLTVAGRVRELGLRPDRADVILPAAMLYERVARRAGADRILVPRVGVREGVLLDLVERATNGRGRAETAQREVEP